MKQQAKWSEKEMRFVPVHFTEIYFALVLNADDKITVTVIIIRRYYV